MGSKKALKDYISGGFSGVGFMTFTREGIRYIYEVGEVEPVDSSTYNAQLIGIYVVGVFYSLSQEYDSVGKSFMQELEAFEQLYNNTFDKQLNRYSAKIPLTVKFQFWLSCVLKNLSRIIYKAWRQTLFLAVSKCAISQ